MKKILLISLLVLGLLIPSISEAQVPGYPRDITLSWTWPTTYVDTTLIQEGDLGGGDIICFRNNDLTATVIDVNIPITTLVGGRQSETLVGMIPQPGTYSCFVTAITVDGIMSDLSNEATKRFTGKPLPPQTFSSP